jgi:hypothetical protein
MGKWTDFLDEERAADDGRWASWVVLGDRLRFTYISDQREVEVEEKGLLRPLFDFSQEDARRLRDWLDDVLKRAEA